MDTANKKITIIIVDDSDIYRVLLFKVLSQDNDIEVISLARSGQLALPRVRHYKPNVVILDMEMPDLDGLNTLAIIRKESPETNVIMFCSETAESAKQTIKALELGAKDFVTKPNEKSSIPIEQYINEKLLTKIKVIVKPLDSSKPVVNFVSPIVQNQNYQKGKYSVCAIGISTGGPDALRQLIPLLPKNLNGSVLIVQHMPAFFTKQLAESLNNISNLEIVEASEGMKIQKGIAYIAPGSKHMVVKRNSALENCISILDTPSEESCKPSANVLFRSVSELYGSSAIGILMTGMGKDGYAGFIEMKRTGAYLLAQNEQSCLVFGMPMLPIKEKLVSEILDIRGLANAIIRLLGTE